MEAQLREYASVEWPAYDWADAKVRTAAFHTVAIPPSGPILRVTVGNRFGERASREAQTLLILAGAGLAVPIPRVLAGPVVSSCWSAILVTRVPGTTPSEATEANPPPEWIASYRSLLKNLHQIDSPAMDGLPAPRAWCGGEGWPDLVEKELVPLLSRNARYSAIARISDLLQVEDTTAGVVCHGDFGPHNILWNHDRAVGLIDFDHACLGDPAIDYAPLVGFHGIDRIKTIAAPELLHRAMFHRATLSLQVAAAAHLNGSIELRDHALANFATRKQRGTLFDPDGAVPPRTVEDAVR